MRNLIVLSLLSALFFSCSADDKLNESYLETLPFDTVTVPESFVSGETTVIGYTYIRPTSCYIFNDLYYSIEGDQRTLAVINRVFENDGNGNACTILDDEIATRTFNFTVKNPVGSTYTFKFWQGEDENGENAYIVVEVPVVE